MTVIMLSCSRLFFRQSYSSEGSSISFGKSIIIISDTTLNYSIKFGGLGVSTTIGYKLLDSLLLIDSVDIYNSDSFQQITNDIFSHTFLYSKDSLIELETNQLYYTNKYSRDLIGSSNNPNVYLIVNGKKKKLRKLNMKRFREKYFTKKYELIELNKGDAKNKYDIDTNDITFKVEKNKRLQ